jgi:hypothetical protein
MLNAMEYPHWLMVAGAVLWRLDLSGLAFRRNREVEPDHEPTKLVNGRPRRHKIKTSDLSCCGSRYRTELCPLAPLPPRGERLLPAADGQLA